jgi:CheY-like chemotaxis protein
VVGNLLNNACKFTHKGGRIDLACSREENEAIITVRDTGIGIAAEHMPHIFEMFMQADTSLERSVSGLGIGLMLVKDLVEQHGGSVQARSAGVGQGAEFEVRLPIVSEPLPITGSTAGEPLGIGGCRILVVDDNLDSASSLATLMELSGNTTQTAHAGLEAVKAAAEFRPHLVLLDLGLPKLNGYEVARRIREQPWGKEMLIVALTGWGQKEDRERSAEAGFDVHLVKPVDYAALTGLLPLPSGNGKEAGRR